jgi:hypothetical protein
VRHGGSVDCASDSDSGDTTRAVDSDGMLQRIHDDEAARAVHRVDTTATLTLTHILELHTSHSGPVASRRRCSCVHPNAAAAHTATTASNAEPRSPTGLMALPHHA